MQNHESEPAGGPAARRAVIIPFPGRKPVEAGDRARLVDLFPGYEKHLVGRGQRPRGVETYMAGIRQFAGFLGADASITDLSEHRITAYRDALAAFQSAPTVALALTIVRSFCKYALRLRLLSEDPTQWVDFPKVTKRPPRALSRAQLRQLWTILAAPEQETPAQRWQRERNRRAIYVMLFAGLRLSEAAALLWGEVDLGAGQLLIPDAKGGAFRAVPLHPMLWAELRRVPNPDPSRAVAGNEDGTPMVRGGMAHIFERWLTARGLDITAHQLRHTFASELLRAGAPLVDIQNALGHENLDTTAIYLKVDGEHLRQAVNLLPGGW
jgi:site-specific recombinase XerD